MAEVLQHDIVIVGGGGAGLRAAIAVSELDQATIRPMRVLLAPSCVVAASWVEFPSPIVALSGETVTEATGTSVMVGASPSHAASTSTKIQDRDAASGLA